MSISVWSEKKWNLTLDFAEVENEVPELPKGESYQVFDLISGASSRKGFRQLFGVSISSPYL